METTPGHEAAVSYVSVQEADDHYASRGGSLWSEADATAKEQALTRATSWIDAVFSSDFRGVPSNGRMQALAWPRRNVVDANGMEVGEQEVPREVKRATMEAAYTALQDERALTFDEAGETPASMEKVGPITIQYAEGPNGETIKGDMGDIVRPILSTVLKRAAWGGFVV